MKTAILALAAAFALSFSAEESKPLPAAAKDNFDSLFEISRKNGGSSPGAGTARPLGAGEVMPDGHPDVSGDAAASAGSPSAASAGGPFADSASVASASADPHGAAGMPSLLPTPGARPPSSVADVKALERVPVLHEGRLKPMITYARHMLLQFSGRTAYQKMSAMQVMSRLLLTPEMTGDYRIFLVNNPEVAEALGVAPEKHRRYTFRQLEKSLVKLQELAEKANAVPDDKRDLVQKEILRLFGNLVEFVNITRTFSFALPNPSYAVALPETRAHLNLDPKASMYSFWDLMSNAQPIARVLEGIGDRGEAERTPMEREIIGLSQAMYLNSQTLHASPFRILPIPPATAATLGVPGWVSPPEMVASPEQLQSFHAELSAWSAAAKAFRSGDQAGFDKAAADYLAAMDNRAFEQLSATHFPLEVKYQKGEPFFWSLVLYWFALLGCFGFFLARKRWLYLGTVWVFLAGFAIHLAGIVSRIVIMNRPPVTSLYETFPFVAAVSILAALFIERINRRRESAGIGLLAASLLGVILLSIANRYAAEGDTMKMLVAVLNSNFWLSTHVVTVTIGYSACLLAGAIAHFYLIRALLPGNAGKPERLKEISKMVYGTLCFGLLFSFIGTVLGGIWADQSWGRFWGWDPKENGALLIVVWCIILLHAKHWGYIRNPGLAQGAVFGSIVVALAWFGVNLLNVGLHSYGFTSGAATKLFAYCGGELLFMLVTFVGMKLGWGSKPTPPKPAPSRAGLGATPV